MRNKLIHLIETANAALLFLLFLSLPCTLVYPEDPQRLLKTGLIILPAAASAFGIRKLKHLTAYLLLAAAVTAAVSALSDGIPEQIYLTAASLLLFLVRIPARAAGTVDVLTIPQPFEALVFLVLAIIGHLVDAPEVGKIAYRYLMVFLVLFFIYTNLTQVSGFLKTNEEIANLPGRQIVRTNRTMLSLFTALSLLFLLILPFLHLDQLLIAAGGGILALIRMLFSLFPGSEPEVAVQETMEAVRDSAGYPMLPPADEGPAWLKAILDFLSWVLAAAIAVACAAGFVYLVIQLFRRFYRPIQENDDTQEFIREEERADLSAREEKKGRREGFFSFLQPDAQIRRIYRSVLKKRFRAQKMNGAPNAAATPSELECSAGLQENDAAKVLHELYEKARYSGKPCLREDVNRLKESGW